MTDFWKDSPRLEAQIAGVESIIVDTLRDPSYPLAGETAEMVLSGGKMLRPALILIGAGFGKTEGRAEETDRIMRIAAAIELLHSATLIHDDVLDNADTRRGTRTLHTRFGVVDAILAGDWLFSSCFRLISENADKKSAQVLSRLVGTVCSAEIRQDLGKFAFSTTARDYMRTIAGKTAALFSLSLYVGASETRTPHGRTQSLRRAGYNLGMAFQVIDDILDYESSAGVMGKPVGNDLKEGLATLPLIYAMEKDRENIAPLLAVRPLDDDSVAAVISRVEVSGGLARARDTAARFTGRARREIAHLPDLPARSELSLLLDKLLARTY
ncbi:MAG: polyprenyl synthetase family protein [Rectinemataceae bacterium]